MEMERPIGIFIIEHHDMVVAGYAHWIADEAGMHLLGHSSYPHEAIGRLHSIPELPDVVVMDYSFGDYGDIISHIPKLRELAPLAAFVIITSYDMPDKLRHINAAGPEAILIKDDTRDCFVQCIRSVAAGGTFLSRAVRDALRIINPARLAFDSLTATQRKVLVLLASAQPDTQVAEALHISVSTLDNHRTPILEKLRAHGFQVYSKAELALWHAQHRHCLE